MARDAVRLMAELIGEKFEPETLGLMTGVDLPQAQQKMMAQQAAMMAQQAGQPVPPEIEQVLTVPSWDDVLQVLRSDAMRGYRVDIETDSTVQADVARLKTNAAEFVQGFGGFIQAVGPAVQAGAMPMDVVADLLIAFARNFKLGRQAEDALERMSKIAAQPAQGADQAAQQQAAEAQAKQAEQQRAAMEAQIEQQRAAMDAQLKQAEMQSKAQIEQAKIGLEQERMAMDAQLKGREIAIREAEVAIEQQRMTIDAQLKERELSLREVEVATEQQRMRTEAQAKQQEQSQASATQTQVLATLAQAMTAPKRVIRGADGRAIAVETDTAMTEAR